MKTPIQVIPETRIGRAVPRGEMDKPGGLVFENFREKHRMIRDGHFECEMPYIAAGIYSSHVLLAVDP